jgi:hypothetical protein
MPSRVLALPPGSAVALLVDRELAERLSAEERLEAEADAVGTRITDDDIDAIPAYQPFDQLPADVRSLR